jgi:hypothetical protein
VRRRLCDVVSWRDQAARDGARRRAWQQLRAWR